MMIKTIDPVKMLAMIFLVVLAYEGLVPFWTTMAILALQLECKITLRKRIVW